MNEKIRDFLKQLFRKKTLRHSDLLATPLDRCLSAFDLTMIGIGHMIGSGIYVITGTVTRNTSGSGIVVSFVIAGIAAALCAFCYAEFGAYIPKAGSSYTYTYVTIGELLAFLIGWSFMLENLIGAAAVSRAWSGYLDSFFSGAIRNGTMKYVGSMNTELLSSHLDFVALGIIVVLTIIVITGARSSTGFNNVLVIVNIAVLLLVIALGFYLADFNYWTSKKYGGFLPYGLGGVIAASGTCFYAYVGFEGIAVAGEEAKNPAKAIPIATALSVIVTAVIYIAAAASLTLMVPYYEIDIIAPFPMAFVRNNLNWARYVVACGALVGMTSVLLNVIYVFPRSIYAMAADGLLFRFLASVNTRTQVPLASVIICSLISGITALLVDIEILVDLMSIGTLLCFTIVSANVLVLRYSNEKRHDLPTEETTPSKADSSTTKTAPAEESTSPSSSPIPPPPLQSPPPLSETTKEAGKGVSDLVTTDDTRNNAGRLKPRFKDFPFLKDLPPQWACNLSVLALTIFIIPFCLILLKASNYVVERTWWAILVLILSSLGIIASFVVLCLHEQNKTAMTYQVPFVPFVPGASMFLNLLMMLQLNAQTWIRLIVWTIIGLFIYFGYGIRHSSERTSKFQLIDEKTALNNGTSKD